MWKTPHAWTASIRTTKTAAGRNHRRYAPQVEALHDRLTPSTFVSGGHLIIHGTVGNDLVSVTLTSDSYKVTESRLDLYFPSTRVTYVPITSVTGDLVFKGFDGNDSFTNSTALRTFAYGGNGNDTLIGGTNQDVLYGEAGDDYLDGAVGSDSLFGGDGNDLLYGGTNVDANHENYLDGGNGNDHLAGGDGADRLIGGPGADSLWGHKGDDTLEGGTGKDMLFGGAGNDRLDGGVGDGEFDYLVGGSGQDSFKFDEYTASSFLGIGLFPLKDNRDAPVDFDPTQDRILRR